MAKKSTKTPRRPKPGKTWSDKLRSAVKAQRVAGRWSTVRGMFWKAVSPSLGAISDENVASHIEQFSREQKSGEPACVYCGERATAWDHLFAPTDGRKGGTGENLTGYGSLLSNLVPACHSCNDKKRHIRWDHWLASEDAYVRRLRELPEYIERVRRLEGLAEQAQRERAELAHIRESDAWRRYMEVMPKLKALMHEADVIAAEIRRAYLERK